MKYMTKGIFVILALSVLFSIGCDWDMNVQNKMVRPGERAAMDALYNDWDDRLDPIVATLILRERVPAEDFGDMINAIRTVEKTFLADKKSGCRNHRKSPTFKTILPDEQYTRIFGEQIKAEVKPVAVVVPEKAPATPETVKAQFLDVEQIEKLVTESKSCRGAADKMRKFLRSKKALTIDDKDVIMEEVLYCKTVELMNEVK